MRTNDQAREKGGVEDLRIFMKINIGIPSESGDYRCRRNGPRAGEGGEEEKKRR